MNQFKSVKAPYLLNFFQKKVHISFMAFFCIILVLQSIAEAKTILICIGDSVTRRWPKGGESFVTLLAEMLGNEYEVMNFGIDGTTMVRGKAHYMTYAQDKFKEIFEIKPDIITLMLGTNDAKPGNWKRYGEFYQADAQAMVDTLLTISPKPRLMLVLPPKAFKNRYSISDSAISSQQVPILRSIAEKAGIETIDVNSHTDSSIYFADGVHLAIEGTEKLAEVYYESIKNEASNFMLWPNGAPGALSNTDADKPMLFAHPVKGASNSAAVIICPGGGYQRLSMDHEGHDVAKWLNERGFSAFVLKYRYSPYKHPIPLNDAKRAMRTVRHLAGRFALDTTRIGVLGFSAGGHLASTLMTHFDNGDPQNADSIEHKNSRPDFGILIYPVITLAGQYAHHGSRDHLLGPSPSAELVSDLCNQLQVTRNTPPAFLAHSDVDGTVRVENSRLFDSALTVNGVHSEFYIDKGKGHGYGLEGQWPDTCAKWLEKLESLLPVKRPKRFSKYGPGVRPVLQLGMPNAFGFPVRNAVYYIVRQNNAVTGTIREQVFLPDGKKVSNGNLPIRKHQ